MSRPLKSLSADKMWRLAEYFEASNYQLPLRSGRLQPFNAAQLQDGFERLQSLQRSEANWSVRLDELHTARPAGAEGYELEQLFRGLQSLDRTLYRRANPPPIGQDELGMLRAGKVHPSRAARIHRDALTEVFRLFNEPFERSFQDCARASLRQVHGEAAAAVTLKSQKPSLEIAAEHVRRAASLEALLRLHQHGQRPLDRPLLLGAVKEMGNYGGAHGREVLASLGAEAVKAGDQELASACARAVARIDRAGCFTTAQVQLEGGPIAAGGIRSYLNALTEKLPALGHPQDVYLPLPGHLSLASAGLAPVPGSGGNIQDARGQEVRFSLLQLQDPPSHPGAPTRTFYFIADDTYFTPRRGVYVDERTQAPFADEKERLFAGAALMNAAMSKVSAIRKLGGGELTDAEVTAAEQTLTSEDAPDLIQFNDSHLAAAHALVQSNGVFRRCAAFGVVHNGDPAYQAWMPRPYLEGALRNAGSRLAALLDEPGDVNLLELMLAEMPVNVVSQGYLDRLLNTPSTQPRLQARLQEVVAEGRGMGIRNGINLSQFDPSRIALPANYSAENLSGKSTCKTAYQAELGLPVDAEAPLLVFGGRISTQKGLRELLAPLAVNEAGVPRTPLDVVLEENPRLQVVLGGEANERNLAEDIVALHERWPDRVRFKFGFIDNKALMAAGDVFLMPSLFEPCGLAQMEAMALGCAVLHTDIDELPNTVAPWDPLYASGEGFRAKPGDPHSLLETLRAAVSWASLPDDAKAPLRRNALRRSETFDASAWAKNMEAFMRHVLNHQDREQGRL